MNARKPTMARFFSSGKRNQGSPPMSTSPPTPPSDDRDQSANFWESAAPYTPWLGGIFGVLFVLWFIGRGGIGLSRPKGTPILVGLRRLMPGIIALSCLNILFLVGGLVYRAAGGAPFRPSAESRKDNLPRDFVQLCAALFTDGNYNAEIVRWIQLSTYTLTALFVLSILGFCSDDSKKEWGCVEDAIGDFPLGEQYKPGEGVRHMRKKTAAMVRERLKERDLNEEQLARVRKIKKQLLKEAGELDRDLVEKVKKESVVAKEKEQELVGLLELRQGGAKGSKNGTNTGTDEYSPTTAETVAQ